MKILMTTDTVGGVWTYALELTRSLRDRGVEVALATMGAPLSPEQRRQASSLDNVTVFTSEYKLEWMHDPWDDVASAGKWLLEIEAASGPSIVHLNGYAHGELPFAAPVVVAAHSCVLSWWQAVKGEPAPMPQWQTYRHNVAAGLHAADAVVAPSKFMLHAIERCYGPVQNSKVIYNARDPSLYSHRVSKEPFVLSAGRLWDEAKNLSALDAVAPQVDWPIHVAGDQTSPDGGRSTPSDNVRCLGRQDEAALARLMSRAAIYALPARYEPFGLSALEAALSGCALVLGDIPSLLEIWADSAAFVAPDDTAALARVLNELIHDEQRRMDLARRARQRAALYTPKRMADSYLQLYRQLARPHVPATAEIATPTFVPNVGG